MKLIVTRPAEDAGPLTAKLEGLGHRVIVLPLLTIVPRSSVAIPPLPWQAVVVTSANGVRAFAGDDRLKSVRILTVGPQSLSAVRAAGFAKCEAHGGDVDGLATFVAEHLRPDDGPILYLSGSETTGDLAGRLKSAGFNCHRAVVYDAVAATMPGPAEAQLRAREVDAVLLYSPRSARIWCDIMGRAGLMEAAARPAYLCLSENVAAQLPVGWRSLVAISPDEAAMLALLEHFAATL
ncbi:MAG: uroporphyrinogen-III synthase [Rhizobiales bacterium]|nr:uroporphyrinogen-III synthase [Hyphomicrobiales bacterium]MBI3671836.1 uroporphyrinogen-III synthase [Hyphomicrobiales bacterium]